MTPRLISISDIVLKGYASAANYKDSLLVCDGISQLPAEPCRFDATLVFVCLSGSLTFSLNMHSHTLHGPAIALVFAGDVVEVEECESMVGYASIFSTAYLKQLGIEDFKAHNFALRVSKSAVARLSAESIALLSPYYFMCKATLEEGLEETDKIMQGLAQAYCHTVISVMKTAAEAEKELKSTSRRQQIFDTFTELVTAHHASERELAAYAEKMRLSSKYLAVTIKEASGHSAQEWINEAVIAEAKTLLRNSSESIKDIAFALNFSTQSSFGKFFKHYTGCSPRRFRQLSK